MIYQKNEWLSCQELYHCQKPSSNVIIFPLCCFRFLPSKYGSQKLCFIFCNFKLLYIESCSFYYFVLILPLLNILVRFIQVAAYNCALSIYFPLWHTICMGQRPWFIPMLFHFVCLALNFWVPPSGAQELMLLSVQGSLPTSHVKGKLPAHCIISLALLSYS